MITEDSPQRWAAHPWQARLIRTVVFLVPIVGSIVFVHFASLAVAMPTSSFLLFIAWWGGMSGAATLVLIALDRTFRRLLPLVALFKLSLVFPDEAPSRFRTALRSNTTETLEQRVARARSGADSSTPVEAAEQLLALASELDKHDHVTRGHAERVRAYAQMIGKELHLSKSELDGLNWAALLHDIGKLSIPEEILNKPGKPTEHEWSILRRHTEFGDQIVEPLKGWLGDSARAVGEHHERWDGEGYPNKLAGEEISLAARIVSVADVFDVITSARSYKQSFAPVLARDEIAHCAGTQFDPRVVRAFLNVSLGRMRFVMGPLSWLTHAPILARMPLTPAMGTVAGSLATVAAAVTTGMIATPPTPILASNAPAAANGVGRSDPIRETTPEGTRVVVGVERVGPGGKVASLSVLEEPARGRVRVTANNRLEFTPPAGFTGTVNVPYEACWPDGSCRRGVVVVTVTPVNDPPVARPDRAVSAGLPVLVDVLGNDSDPEGDRLSLVSVSDVVGSRSQVLDRIVLPAGAQSQTARASIEGRRIRFTPESGFVGTATFVYMIRDDAGGRATALVRVKVTAPPKAADPADPAQAPDEQQPGAAGEGSETPGDSSGGSSDDSTPPPSEEPAAVAPKAVGDRVSVPQGRTVLVDVLANDTAESALSLVSVGDPSRGATEKVGNRVRFTAPTDFVGAVSFPYTISDADGGRDRGTVSVTVLLVNVAPSFTPGPAQSVVQNAGAQTVPGWASDIDPGAPSEADQKVSFLVSSDNPGLFAVQPQLDAAGTLTYTPAAGASGRATVTVRARDDGGTARGGSDTSPPATFTITVTSPANNPPVAAADAVSSAEDTAVTVSVLTNDSDPDTGDSVSILSYNGASIANGTLTHHGGGSFTYAPNADWFGSETFTYTIRDGSAATATATVTITVTSVNDPPEASNDDYTTQVGTDLVVAAPGLLANDSDPDAGDTITLATTPVLLSGPSFGAVAIDPDALGGFTYKPQSGYTGQDSFRYRITDGAGLSDEGTVTITVTATAVTTSSLFFHPGSPAATTWSMSAAMAPAAAWNADPDLDGSPGLTIQSSSGSATTTDPQEFKAWAYTTSAPLVLNGPVSLQLWSAVAGFLNWHSGHPQIYLYDCDGSGASCVQLAANDVHVGPWGTWPSTWVSNTFAVGSVSHTITTGRMLKVLLLFRHRNMWVATTQDYPTGLTLSIG